MRTDAVNRKCDVSQAATAACVYMCINWRTSQVLLLLTGNGRVHRHCVMEAVLHARLHTKWCATWLHKVAPNMHLILHHSNLFYERLNAIMWQHNVDILLQGERVYVALTVCGDFGNSQFYFRSIFISLAGCAITVTNY